MIRKYFFSEEFSGNIIWVMLSGFFLKIEAKENILGQIIMAKDHYLFNLDEKKINNEYLNYNNLHYILFDGATEYLSDTRLHNIKKKVNIYYVGKLNNFWKDIKNSEPLFPASFDEFNDLLPKIKKRFPIFFKKYFFKKFITTLINAKKLRLFNNHVYLDFGSKVGTDTVYPRQALLNLSNRKTVRFNLNESLFSMNNDNSYLYLKDIIDKFLYDLDVKT
jgi:hypothetical protein